MLVVKVEIWPHGEERMAETLDTVFIGNDSTGKRNECGEMIEGNYDVYTQDPRGGEYPRSRRAGHIGRIEGLSREGVDRNRRTLAGRALDLAAEAAEGA
jgi:hypothetical protein